MIQLDFILTFASDWHVGAGFGDSTLVDALLERDPDGVPFVRGATLKGLFRESLYDLSTLTCLKDLGDSPDLSELVCLSDGKTPITDLLGSAEHESEWFFSAARPVLNGSSEPGHARESQPGTDFAQVVTGVRVDPRLRRAEENKFYRRELGTSAYQFAFRVTGNGLTEDVAWLVAAARFVRRLGNRRRRGAGACEIELADKQLQEELLNIFAALVREKSAQEIDLPQQPTAYTADDAQSIRARRFRVILRTESPLILAEKPEAGNLFRSMDHIPARTLRGALAARIGPGHLATAAYNDFRTLFIDGAMHLDNLLPLMAGAPLIEAPLGLLYQPEVTNGPLKSVLWDSSPAATQTGWRAYRGKYHTLTNDMPKMNPVEAQTHMHVQIDPHTKRALDSNLFAYEALPTGLLFVGELRLNMDWSTLAALLEVNPQEPFELYLGKGRRRGYGRCWVWLEPLDDTVPPLQTLPPLRQRLAMNNARVVMTLISDTILLDPWSRAIQRFEANWLAQELGVDTDHIRDIRSFVQTRLVEGFDLRSGLPAWRDLALVGTSSVSFEIATTLSEVLISHWEALERDGIGLRRSEGFGRLIFNHPLHTGQLTGFADKVDIPTLMQPSAPKTELLSEFEATWRNILNERLMPQIFNDEAFRSLARRLHETAPPNPDAIFELIETARAAAKSRGKESRLQMDTLQIIAVLVNGLHEHYPNFWRQGLSMLAMAIASQVVGEAKSE